MRDYERLKSITILYVEDSKFLSKMTAYSIRDYFNKIYIAHDGQEGLRLLREYNAEIDIVVTDLIMPILDGKQMIKQIREGGCSVPIIVTTGYDEYMEREKMLEFSIGAFLSKPIDKHKLLDSIDDTIDALFIKRELATKKAMIDNDIIYSESDKNGIIRYVSKPFERISGYSKEELLGNTHAILKSKETSESTYKEMWKNLSSYKQWQGEITNRKKDGSLYSVNMIISPMYFRNKLIGYSATSLDTTELKRTSAELQAKSKHAALGEMIAMIAHQWRQPITSIGMIANNLQFDMLMDELDINVLEENLKIIDSHVKHLSSTIDVFKNFLQESKTKESIVMQNIIKEALLVLREDARDTKIKYDVDEKCASIEFDTFKDELVQAIINIIINSKDALIQNNIEEPKIKIICAKDSDFITISISDNGGGIDDDVLPKIFTPYFSTKNEKNGTGLGLYMTKTIVEENLDGELSVSNIDNGAIFTIKLPYKS